MKVKNMIFIVGAGFMLLTGCGATAQITHPYVQEYISGQGNVKGMLTRRILLIAIRVLR